MRYMGLAAAVAGVIIFGLTYPLAWLPDVRAILFGAFVVCIALVALGIWDLIQTSHSLKRNYPILANLRFVLEKIRPEIRQYFLESETDGTPFNRAKRSVVYQRAKGQLDKRPFGTQQDIYGSNFEWINHSLAPRPSDGHNFRVVVGGPDCREPYSLSLLNISAMSFGALSANAIRALNKGAKMGGFAHDTGEGGLSAYHREFGGDIVWEIGSGYFGCRNEDGSFSPDRFAAMAREPQVKMIEIKLSQGAKPGHGGVLPGPKVSSEIAAARGVPMGIDCISPARHPAFGTPLELVQFIAKLRELSGGKPTGFKLCIGHPWEFMAICKAMLETGIRADFIVIDGKEGGTGASPLEFADHVGTPLREGLLFAHWSAAACARPSASERAGASLPASTWPVSCRSVPIGATSRAGSCLRWAACRLRPVTPIIARAALQRRTGYASARSWWKPRRSASRAFITTRSPRWVSWSEQPAWRIQTSCGRITSSSVSPPVR